MKKIVCKSGKQTMTFKEALPLFLTQTSGITESVNEIITQQTNSQSGEIHAGNSVTRRNIIIMLTLYKNVPSLAEQLLTFFAPDSVGQLYYYPDDLSGKTIDYYTEYIKVDEQGFTRTATISLICPDPHFRAIEAVTQSMSNWKRLLKFPFVYGPPIIVATRNQSKMATFKNNSNVKTGIIAKIYAMGDVSNPSLTLVETGESLKINTAMKNGDVLEISTENGNKHVTLNGENINNLWEFGGTWIQLPFGESSITYDADTGSGNMSVTISYTENYNGA